MTLGADPGWTPPPQPVGPATGLRYAGFWIRTLAYLIDALLLAILMAVWVAADGRKQGWHDKLAGTVVVRPSG